MGLITWSFSATSEWLCLHWTSCQHLQALGPHSFGAHHSLRLTGEVLSSLFTQKFPVWGFQWGDQYLIPYSCFLYRNNCLGSHCQMDRDKEFGELTFSCCFKSPFYLSVCLFMSFCLLPVYLYCANCFHVCVWVQACAYMHVLLWIELEIDIEYLLQLFSILLF